MKNSGEIVYPLCVVALYITIIIHVCSTYNFDWQKVDYVVKRGDTLWDICKLHCPDNMNIWEYINLVKDESELISSTIHEGDIITILKEQKNEQ